MRRSLGRGAATGSLLATIALLALASACGGASEPGRSLVLVTLDTLRRDHVGIHRPGEAAALTPRLDALAARGRVFERAFTPMPTTAPAHASILTGLHPHEHGVERNGDRVRAGVREASLARRLRDAGYRTGAFVTSPGSVFGRGMGLGGFQRWDQNRAGRVRMGRDAADAALAWLDELGGPFFLWLHVYDPHSPYGSAARKRAAFPPDRTRYGWVEPALYEDPAARRRMAARYRAGVREADGALGHLLRGLEARSLEAVLAVTSDHGEFLDERLDAVGFAYGHGKQLGPEVLRVPLVLAGPGIEPGREAAPVSLRDLYPTLLGLAGLADRAPGRDRRFDLRDALPERRVLLAARRRFASRASLRRQVGPHALRALRANAVAATDGSTLVVLGEDGSPLQRSKDAPALEEAGRAMLAGVRSARAAHAPERRVLDEATREELRALGYLP